MITGMVMSLLSDSYKKQKLTKEEAMIYDLMKPKNRRTFLKMSDRKREKVVKQIIKKLERKHVDVSEFVKAEDMANNLKRKYAMTNEEKKMTSNAKGTITAKTDELFTKNSGGISGASGKSRLVNEGLEEMRKVTAQQADKMMEAESRYEKKKNRSIEEAQREYLSRMSAATADAAGKAVQSSTSRKLAASAGNVISQVAAAAASMVMAIIPIMLPVILIIVVLVVILTIIFGSVALNEEQTDEYGTYEVSATVLQYRDKILNELKKYGKEEYIDLMLAVVQQESGGTGNDIFRASESLGLTPGTISVNESISQGVKIMCKNMTDKRVNVSSTGDIAHIRVALQAYNYGGGYITYINDGKDGSWTQENALSYQKKMASQTRTGTSARILGPYAYGDAYYTDHVLRYYSPAGSSKTSAEVKGINVTDRLKWLFPEGIPTTETAARSYMQTISVPIYTQAGQKSSMNITVNKKLVNAYRQAFEGMYKIRFPVDAGTTAAYCWRQMASNATKQSYHSYGSCIDINWNSNPATYTGGSYNPGNDPMSITSDVVKIWADAGFFWGGAWDGYFRDYMHFTYTNN